MPHVETGTGWRQGVARSPWLSMGKRCNAADADFDLDLKGRLALGALRRHRSIGSLAWNTMQHSLRLASHPNATRRGVRFLLT